MSVQEDLFCLTDFEGSLDFLLCLIQKEEIHIYDVSIQEIIQQFIHKLIDCKEKGLEKGAEFIGVAAYLVWLKSKMLLPHHENEQLESENSFEDPHFEIIHHLVDYCRFKEAAKELTLRHEKQQACYFRGIETPEWRKSLGIDHLSLEELTLLFKEMVQRTSQNKGHIQEENWKVSDKIQILRQLLEKDSPFPFLLLFSPQQSRLEMIVIFLAILELMKSGELAVGREQSSSNLLIFSSCLPKGRKE